MSNDPIIQVVPLPENMSRPETGVMQFADDWPGIFIRGDNALHFGMMLRAFAAGEPFYRSVVDRLMALLGSCNAANLPRPLSAAPVMAAATGWQDMATAPKDGTPILVWWSTTPPAAFETYWHSDESQGDKPGWYSPGWGHILAGRIELGWMPLPSLPDPPAINAALAIAAGQLGEKESGE